MNRRDFLLSATASATLLCLPGFSLKAAAKRRRISPKQWRGFNLLNYFNPYDTEPFKEEEFKWVAEWGFNFLRLPLSYWAWSKPGEYYQMDLKVLKDIDRAVEWGRKYGIHICINFHRAPGYCVNPPKEPQNLFLDEEALDGCVHQWTVFAKRYRKVSSRFLSFNLINEVAGVDAPDYERVVRKMVEAIRKISPKRLVLIDGLDFGSHPLLDIPDLKEVVQCGRGYQPMLISHYAATWVYGNEPMSIPREKLTWPLEAHGKTYDHEYLRKGLSETWKPLLEQGDNVFIGEFGAHNQTPHQVALAWLRDNLSIFRQLGYGWALWNLKGSFGVLDSYRDDVEYETFNGHRLDRKMLQLLQEFC